MKLTPVGHQKKVNKFVTTTDRQTDRQTARQTYQKVYKGRIEFLKINKKHYMIYICNYITNSYT